MKINLADIIPFSPLPGLLTRQIKENQSDNSRIQELLKAHPIINFKWNPLKKFNLPELN